MPDLETSLTYCTFCPNLCRHRCPVSNNEPRETLIPRAKMSNLRRLVRHELEHSTENDASLYACTGCGACHEACRVDVEPAAALFAARATAQQKGAGHPALASLPVRFAENAARASAAARASFETDADTSGTNAHGTQAPARVATRFPSEAQVALLPSCEDGGAARRTTELLARLGADYVVVADVRKSCGGYPLLAGGYKDEFRAYAEVFAAEVAGYAKLVVACPACAHTLRHDYPAHGVTLRPEVLHLAEFLGTLAAGVTPTRKLPAAYYHDPCYLGRRDGVYDAPRRLLERVLDGVKEFSRNRADADCCGGGGLLPLTMPETAEAIASDRLREPLAARTGEAPAQVVTACPTCKKRLSREGVVVRDLVECLDEATRPLA